MSDNLQHVMERGSKLDHMSLLSENLALDSKKYMKDSKYLNIRALYFRYAALILIIFVIIIFIYIIFKIL